MTAHKQLRALGIARARGPEFQAEPVNVGEAGESAGWWASWTPPSITRSRIWLTGSSWTILPTLDLVVPSRRY
jgi:hypothetical protein